MIRIVCQEVELSPTGEVMGRRMVTFDVELPVLERYLEGATPYEGRSVLGGELLQDPPRADGEGG